MSILTTDLQILSSANDAAVVDDVSTAGGAVSSVARPTLDQFSANAVASIQSDGADTRNVTITGRLATGAVDTETLALNGVTPVLGSKTWERVHSVVAASGDAARTITFKQGSGGTTRATITPNETTRHIDFQRSSSGASGKDYYSKHFWKNAHATLTLSSAQLTLTVDTSSKVKIGNAPSVGDSATVTNRLTAPSSVTFVDDGVAQSVPGGSLAAGASIGMWTDLTLASNDAALKSSYTTQLSGTTV